jgi:hypothetical protein
MSESVSDPRHETRDTYGDEEMRFSRVESDPLYTTLGPLEGRLSLMFRYLMDQDGLVRSYPSPAANQEPSSVPPTRCMAGNRTCALTIHRDGSEIIPLSMPSDLFRCSSDLDDDQDPTIPLILGRSDPFRVGDLLRPVQSFRGGGRGERGVQVGQGRACYLRRNEG